MSDPSSDDLRNRFEARLRDELSDLAASSDNTSADRKPVTLDQQSVGRLSRMDAMQGQAMAAALDARRKGRGRAIEAALQRMAEQEFGWCEDCGEFIGLKRLDLDPVLTRCVSCAS